MVFGRVPRKKVKILKEIQATDTEGQKYPQKGVPSGDKISNEETHHKRHDEE